MKSLKTQFIGAIAMVLVAAIAMGSSTYAWFAMNKQVEARNMMVTATAEGSLVITRGALPTAATSDTYVNINDASAVKLLASTHDSTWATYTTGLKTVGNPEDVSATTGLALAGASLSEVPAVNVSGKTPYYNDYTVFIASSGSALTAQDLTAEIITPSSAVTDLNGAISIDFYYMAADGTATPTLSNATFAGTLNLAGLDPVANDAGTAKTSIVMDGSVIGGASGSGITIPKAGDTNGAVTVMMRVYVDGALKDTNSTTFIKTVNASQIDDTTISVRFTASAHA